ncbi:MAG: hypothetical protein ACT4OP_11600 [Actinomycetota bacterium]
MAQVVRQMANDLDRLLAIKIKTSYVETSTLTELFGLCGRRCPVSGDPGCMSRDMADTTIGRVASVKPTMPKRRLGDFISVPAQRRLAAIVVLAIATLSCDATPVDSEVVAAARSVLVVDENDVFAVRGDSLEIEQVSKLGAGDAVAQPGADGHSLVAVGFADHELITTVQWFSGADSSPTSTHEIEGFLHSPAPPPQATMTISPSGRSVVVPLAPDWESNDDPAIQFDAYLGVMSLATGTMEAGPVLLDDCGLPYLYNDAASLFVFCNHTQDVRVGRFSDDSIELRGIARLPMVENIARDVNGNPFPLQIIAGGIMLERGLMLVSRDGQVATVASTGVVESGSALALEPQEWVADGVMASIGSEIVIGLGNIADRLESFHTTAHGLAFVSPEGRITRRVELAGPITSIAFASFDTMLAVSQHAKGEVATLISMDRNGTSNELRGSIGSVAVLRG